MLRSRLIKPRKVRFSRYSVIGLALSFVLHLMVQAQSSRSPAATSAARATGALKVITGQAGSVVFINNVRHGTTNDKGELDLPRVQAGSYAARVRTVGYSDWTGPVVIAA
ncbi:MAG TPA: hypothetical protein VJZ26_06620, partial [Blastocatellia bacterium]|nr:hypothetical protein [Blastocatellia bacterium]